MFLKFPSIEIPNFANYARYSDFSVGCILSDYGLCFLFMILAYFLYNKQKQIVELMSKDKITLPVCYSPQQIMTQVYQVRAFYKLNAIVLVFNGLLALFGAFHHHFFFDRSTKSNEVSWYLANIFGDLAPFLHGFSPILIGFNFSSIFKAKLFVRILVSLSCLYSTEEILFSYIGFGVGAGLMNVFRLILLIVIFGFKNKYYACNNHTDEGLTNNIQEITKKIPIHKRKFTSINSYFKFRRSAGYLGGLCLALAGFIWFNFKPICLQPLAYSKGCPFPDWCNHNCVMHILTGLCFALQYWAFI